MHGMKTDMQNQVEQVDRIGLSLQTTLVKNQGLMVVVGRDEQGGDIAFDLATLPHLLIGGSTGSGKSVCIKSILSQLMRTKSPDEVKFIIYDEKCIEFRRMGNCPYLFMPVITDPQVLLSVLEAVRDELEDRTQAIRNGDPVTRIVVVADEYAGLMVSHSERAEPLLAKMLVLGRAAGVHFVFATQRPDEVVMSPPLRCGFPGRIAFKVAFEEDSRMIIGENGADRLNGKGDFLFRDSTGLHRGQVAKAISCSAIRRACIAARFRTFPTRISKACARVDAENCMS